MQIIFHLPVFLWIIFKFLYFSRSDGNAGHNSGSLTVHQDSDLIDRTDLLNASSVVNANTFVPWFFRTQPGICLYVKLC